MPVVAEVFGNIGITKDDVGFICSGSTDYLIGGPFSFVAALDAVGVWPPRAESHVEMDGAWALYEAWVLLQEGEIDAALVYCFGRSSMGDLSEILSVQLDPYYLAPLVARPDLAGRPAGASDDRRRQGHRGRLRRRGQSLPALGPGQPQGPGRLRPHARAAPGRGLRGGAPAAPRAAPADRRLRCRRAGGGRQGLRVVRASSLHHRDRPPDGNALGRRPRPHRVAVHEARGREGRGGGEEGRRRRAARAVRPPGADPEPRRSGWATASPSTPRVARWRPTR